MVALNNITSPLTGKSASRGLSVLGPAKPAGNVKNSLDD